MRCCSRLILSLAGALALLLFAGAATAAVTGTPVRHSSIKAASEAAAADQSLVLVVFGADWCKPRKQLKAETLGSKEFQEQAGALHLVEVDVDADTDAARDYGVREVPTLVFLTADNKMVGRRTGFMATAELLLWLREARDRVKEGKWEGMAPTSKLGELVKKAADSNLDTNDLARLVVLLGEPEPADREAAAGLLAARRDDVVIPLIDAVTNSSLGVRIGAAELLHALAPSAPGVDAWQSPSELGDTVASLRQWWTKTGRLPAPETAPKIDAAGLAAVGGALEALRGDDPARRTPAMSTLVACGPAALPAIRNSIKAAEKAGDQRTLALLEDVRWAILVPDTLEQRAAGVRSVLARGKGPERQAAATRLGHAGRGAIPALAELLNDADPLVVETAVRALSGIGEKDAIPAMAALLKASDSNLRMTAAQALGHSKNRAALPDLLTVIDDPNEVVACTALSALEELNADEDYSPNKKAQPPEVIRALKSALSDPRWRVRAAAAETAGKLSARELIADLKALLEDADGFVIKNTLESLRKMGGTPEPARLAAIAQRYSGLRSDAVGMLVGWNSEDAVKSVIDLYRSSNVEGRLAILASLSSASSRGQQSTAWQPFLAQAATESDPRLRRAAAGALAAQPAKVAAALVGPLLADEDAETRSQAAGAVLSILGEERASAQAYSDSRSSIMLSSLGLNTSAVRSKATNEPPATASQIREWHAVLQQKAGAAPNAITAAAIYVTGDTNADLPILQAALERADTNALFQFSRSAALAALAPRLPWPAAKPLAERFCLSPDLFLRLMGYTGKAPRGLREFLLEPARFKAAVEAASEQDLQRTLPQWLSSGQSQGNPFSGGANSEPLLLALLESTNAGWRAAAVHVVGLREEAKWLPQLQRAAGDSNEWVRAAAIAGLTRAAKDRATLEQRLGPLLADPNKRVVQMAALGLLEPETRSAAGLDYNFGMFQFNTIHAWSDYHTTSGEQRPLTPIDGKPAFLEQARRLAAANTPEEAIVPVLLLAQYGDFTGLERLLAAPSGDDHKEREPNTALLAGIALSRDVKYLPQVKRMAANAKDEGSLRQLLQALRGMSGPEVRDLRLDINKRLRQTPQ